DETFKIVLWMVVFSTLWLCLDLAIHAQYGQDRGVRDELSRAINVLPALGFVIYFTAKYPASLLTRAFLFGWSAIGGSYMIHIVNKAGYLQVMRRCPILGSIWIWAIVQLDLPSALISLAAVAAY
ncbi:hypothetical protein P389DRAFT_137714, partial [Cystobasidium minutum MCA 4210]|uniref:uncharacterized protein n=1 Tax=Cystobasidium minutum MCA 4210 TaxID=1397322 RepID=UPI0034CF3943